MELDETIKKALESAEAERQKLIAKKEQEQFDKERELLCMSPEEFETYLKIRDSYVPTLKQVDEILERKIVGEEYNRLSVFTVFILSDICVYISGDSGAGKTQLMEAVSYTLLPGKVCFVSQGSDKAIFANKKAKEIEKASYVVLPELNKIASNPGIVEMMKSWGEGKDGTYDRSVYGTGIDKVILPCRPFMFSRATESSQIAPVPGELMTRVAEFMVDSSRDQTLSVMEAIAEEAEHPFIETKIDRAKEAAIRYYISNLNKNKHYINPMARVLVDYVPAVFAASRRDFKKYLKNINGICNFHYTNRMHLSAPDGKHVLLVTPLDVFYNHVIFGQTLIRSAMRCNQIERKIIKVCEEKPGVTKNEVRKALQLVNITTTLNNIESHIKELENIGYIMSERDGREYRYYVTDDYKEFNVKPDFKKLVEHTINTINAHDYLTAAQKKEYISRYCSGDGLKAIHPFTGREVNILDYKFDDINNEHVCTDSVNIRPSQKGLDVFG